MRKRIAAAAGLVLVIAATAPGIAGTVRLRWPYDLDQFRDVAAAQAIRDGAWGTDPFYAHEAAWYNPLIPAGVALLSAVSNVPVPQVLARTGAWANALGPLAFFACATALTGAEAALFATVAFLFLPPNPPPWAPGTYTPWLFPAATTQALLYFGIILIARALAGRTTKATVAVGVVIGITFLAHTAPALLLAAAFALGALFDPGIASWRARLVPIAIAALTALIIASPFLLPLATRYHLAMQNRAPAMWGYTPGAPRAALAYLSRPDTVILGAFAVVGCVVLWRRGPSRENAVFAAWGIAALLLTGYSLAAQQTLVLPPIVPAYHFLFQWLAWAWVLVGVGASATASAACKRFSPRVTLLVPTAVALIVSAVLYPVYLRRQALTGAVAAARRLSVGSERIAYQWIRTSTPHDAVFLASDADGQIIAAPAGRHVVCVDPSFSNPYLNYAERLAARNRMLEAIDAHAWTEFEGLAHAYDVQYVIARDARAADLLTSHHLAFAFSAGDIFVFRTAATTRPGP